MNTDARPPIFSWDIFCQVIDNFGDLGVCWRLAVNLAKRGQPVRLWIDQPQALSWMAPEGAHGVQVVPWTNPLDMTDITPGQVLIEAFGCTIAPEFIAAYADAVRRGAHPCHWINLEYLSAEAYVEQCHTLPSPVMSGPGKGLCKHFFYPGFTPRSGGLLREPDLLERQSQFDRDAWLAQQGIHWQGERLISLFCYEPPGLERLLDALAKDQKPSLLLVTAGRASVAVQRLLAHHAITQPDWNSQARVSLVFLPTLPQIAFDQLLWACDLNFVRGEDSLVRALWAGKALVWQIYPQDDDAHHIKLDAFLNWLQASDSLREYHLAWNGIGKQTLPDMAIENWQHTISRARKSLLEQTDLASALVQFVGKTD